MFTLAEMEISALHYKSLFLFMVVIAHDGFAQSGNVNYWNALADVTFVTKQTNGYEIELPKFGNKVMALQGKKISVKGYLIPLSESGSDSKYMLSSLPFNSCFFCGAAGFLLSGPGTGARHVF